MNAPLLQAAQTARSVTIDTLSVGGDVLVLAPHPDDETLGCGGAIAALTDLGRRAQVIVVTDGAQSHPASRSHPPDILRQLRAGEVMQAVDILTRQRGPEPVLLGYPDNAALEAKELDAVIARILPYITPQTRAVWCTWGGDPHDDHARCAKLALRLLAQQPRLTLWSYPIWGRFDDTQPENATDKLLLFHTEDWQNLKQAAIAAHRSQMSDLIQDDPGGFRMTDDHQFHFCETPEIFIKECTK